MQRALIITAALFVLVGVGVFAYLYFFANGAGVEVTTGGSVSLPSAGQGALPTEGTAGETTIPSASTTIPARFVQISKGPVVPSEVVVGKPGTASSSPEVAVNYIERQSGNIYSYAVRAGVLTRTSNRTLPGIQSAAWSANASTAFVRYLSGENFSASNLYALPANGSDGFFLPQNLSDIAVSSAGILMLVSGVNGSVASLARLDGTGAKEVFMTSLSDLRISFAGTNRYFAYTKPSATLPGAAFLVDSNGRFSRVAGPLRGLVAKASPSGKWALISYTDAQNAMQLTLVETATGESLPLPVGTIADKCVWTADDSAIYCGVPVDPTAQALYPDDWYQGAVSFSDRIWKIAVAGRYAQLTLDSSKEADISIDAEALAIDPAGTVLVFVNKADGSLWSYSL